MSTTLRFASCLLLATLLAPAPVNLADDKDQARQTEEPARPKVHEFSEEELSAARKTLADLTPEQRATVNHLRYLLRPQYEEELMTGRAFTPCPLPPWEQPAPELQNLELMRLWAVLSSGMPVAESTKQRLQLMLDAPVPSVGDSLGEVGMQMAVCLHGVRHPELELGEALTARAEELLDEAMDSRRTTDDRSPLIVGKRIDPKWFANQLWRSLICRSALELELKLNEHIWERSLRNLLGAGDDENGWRSKFNGNSEVEDLDSNLFAIAALSLAATAPEGTLGKGILHSIEKALEEAPGVLKRLDRNFPDAALVGTRLAMILSFAPELAPEGNEADAWRTSVMQPAMEGHDTSGVVSETTSTGRALGVVDARSAARIVETALACVALSGGLQGGEPALADLGLAEIGRAMHACSVLHANELPEGARRAFTFNGNGHDLPEPGEIEDFMLDGIDYLVSVQHDAGGWGSSWAGRGAQSETCDPGTTSFAALALMRAGHTPFFGEHKDAVLNATEYILEAVEEAKDDGARITEATGTQLQRKLGDIVDTAITTQFLARVLPMTDADPALRMRVEDALDKCLRKIEDSQREDGSWVTQGWAPVLQSAMYNQALELSVLAGCEVDADVLRRSRAYLARDVEVEDGKTTTKKAASAGVAFYAGSSALRATSSDAAEVTLVMERARKDRTIPSNAEVSEKYLRKIGYSDEAATAKATAFLQHEALLEKLEDENYLKGFGNNGGEEFISYMLSSESIVITGHETWDDWNKKLHTTFAKIQNEDGSWSGHHCITSPVICTAAVLLTLTADREVHVVVETGPTDHSHTTQATKKEDTREEPKSPITGK